MTPEQQKLFEQYETCRPLMAEAIKNLAGAIVGLNNVAVMVDGLMQQLKASLTEKGHA